MIAKCWAAAGLLTKEDSPFVRAAVDVCKNSLVRRHYLHEVWAWSWFADDHAYYKQLIVRRNC